MKKIIFFIMVVVLIFAVVGILYHNTFVANNENIVDDNSLVQEQESTEDETKTDSDIVEISLESVSGITQQEAEKLCFSVLGEKDEDTGFTFSFGTAGAVEKDGKQYYVIRASWLVNNSHLSYIGDFFVSADGKTIYNGLAQHGEYKMSNVIWSE